ncbi:MAG TPA: hypothetical protein VF126_11950 [Acidobacteriaceae bacterium]
MKKQIFGSRGQTVQHLEASMRAAICAMFFLLSTVAPVHTDDYFPKNVFGSSKLDSFRAEFYLAHLKFLHEPSLLLESRDRKAQSYRFLWLRTFHHAVVIRLDILSDGTGTLVTKMSSGGAGFGMPDRKIIEDVSRPVSRAEVQSLLAVLDEKHFMKIPSYITHDQTGTDGSEWVLEGVRDGQYHVVARWTPCNHSGSGKQVVCSIGRTFAFDLGHLPIPENEVY